MQTITIIINELPYKNDKAWNALRLADELVNQDVKAKRASPNPLPAAIVPVRLQQTQRSSAYIGHIRLPHASFVSHEPEQFRPGKGFGTLSGIFLLADGVDVGKENQATKGKEYNLEELTKKLLAKDVSFITCSTCLKVCGVSREKLIDKVVAGHMSDLAKWAKESDKILTF